MVRRSTLCILAGLALICAAAGFVLRNVAEEREAASFSGDVMAVLETRRETPASTDGFAASAEPSSSASPAPLGASSEPEWARNPDMSMPVTEVNGRRYVGTLELPTIGVELPVGEEYTPEALKQSPCLYSGSVYRKDAVICAHNYRSHFGSLKKLNEGDPARFTDSDGNLFSYRVSRLEILDGDDVDGMLAGDDWDLTLFTCTLARTTRVTVRCVLES